MGITLHKIPKYWLWRYFIPKWILYILVFSQESSTKDGTELVPTGLTGQGQPIPAKSADQHDASVKAATEQVLIHRRCLYIMIFS